MTQANKVGVINLVDAGVPADQGLSSLGLLMQLAGTAFAAFATLVAFVLLFGSRNREASLWILLVFALCIARSLFHRAAGTEMLYPKRGRDGHDVPFDPVPEDHTVKPTGALRRYITVALAHSGLIAMLMAFELHSSAKAVVATGAALAAWPAMLGVMFMLPRFRRFSAAIPVGEDKGFEAAAVLMTLLGLCGALGTASIAIIMVDVGGPVLQGPAVLVLFALIMLVIRSAIHVQAGLSGLRETSVDRSVELANRYSNFGVISSFCTGGALLLVAMTSQVDLRAIGLVAGLCWMLMAWPMIIRRFFSERQFADLIAGDNAAVHRRAPDAGLTGLGWFLIGHAVLVAAMLVPRCVLGRDDLGHTGRDLVELLGLFTRGGDMSPWWSVGVLVLEAWAGYELVRMSVQHKVIASIYAVVAIAVAVYAAWPMIRLLHDIHHSYASGPVMMTLAPIATELAIPIAALILVNRKIAPMARARFRTRAPAPTPS